MLRQVSMIYCIQLYYPHFRKREPLCLNTLNSSIFLFVTKHEKKSRKEELLFCFCIVRTGDISSAVSTFLKRIYLLLNKISSFFLYEIESVAECFLFHEDRVKKYSVKGGNMYTREGLGWRYYLGPTAGHLSSDRCCAYLQNEKYVSGLKTKKTKRETDTPNKTFKCDIFIYRDDRGREGFSDSWHWYHWCPAKRWPFFFLSFSFYIAAVYM
jgi:hypothetical protein